MTHWPWRRVAMQALDSGKVPFVNETASGGQPLLANPNAVLLYPTLLLERVLPPASAFNVHYLIHVLWAFFGARALASRFGLAGGAALFSGVAYAFSGTMLSYGSAFANAAPAASWLPWCAAATIDVVRAGSRRRLAGTGMAAGLAFGLQLLAGEPAISLLTLVFCAVVAVAGWLGAAGPRAPHLARIAGGGLLGAGIAAAVAAPLLLPLREILPLTYRGQHLYSERAFGASPFAPWRIVEWLFPRWNGDPGTLGAGAHWQFRFHEGEIVYIWCVTFGVIPLLVLLRGAARRDFWTSKTFLLAGTALVTLLLSFGFALPLYRLLYSVEFLRRFRYPIKFYLLTTLCVALLAGFAVEALRRRRAGSVEAILLGAAVAIYAAAYLAAVPDGPLDRAVRPHLAGLASPAEEVLAVVRRVLRGDALLGGAAAILLAIVVFARWPQRGRAYVIGFATLFFAFPWGLPLFVSADHRTLEHAPALRRFLAGGGRLYVSPEVGELAQLEAQTAHHEVPPTVAKLAHVQIEELIPATAAPFGVRYLFEEDPDGSYGWVNRIAGEVLTASSPEERARLLRVYGGRWALAEAGSVLPGFVPVTGLSVAGHRLVLHERDAVRELRWASRAHRRATLSGAFELARSDLFRPATDVVLAGSRDEPPTTAARGASIRIEALESDRAAADVVAPAAGHVVWSRTFFPPWRATLDAKPARVLLGNGRDLAVAVPAGRHRLEIFWNPGTFRLGVAAQLFAMLAALAAAAVELRRRASTEAGGAENG
jgi:hypothetical protein